MAVLVHTYDGYLTSRRYVYVPRVDSVSSIYPWSNVRIDSPLMIDVNIFSKTSIVSHKQTQQPVWSGILADKFFLGSELVITSLPSFNEQLAVALYRKAAHYNSYSRSSYLESLHLSFRIQNIWTTSTMTARKHRQHFVHFPIPCFIFHHHHIHVIVHRLSCWWCTQNFDQETTNLNTAGFLSVLALVYCVSSTYSLGFNYGTTQLKTQFLKTTPPNYDVHLRAVLSHHSSSAPYSTIVHHISTALSPNIWMNSRKRHWTVNRLALFAFIRYFCLPQLAVYINVNK